MNDMQKLMSLSMLVNSLLFIILMCLWHKWESIVFLVFTIMSVVKFYQNK